MVERMEAIQPMPKVKLSKLRDIGWRLWDPIGMSSSKGNWDHPANQLFASEYDSYLISAASQLRRGTPREEVVEYLFDIETKHMGLGERTSSRKRAEAVVDAILDDERIWSWPE